MKPDEIAALRKRLQLSQQQFGEALGYADGRRRVRLWEEGYRAGEPYGPSASALAAIRYLQAITLALDGIHIADRVETEQTLRQALPEFMKEPRRGR